MLSLSEFDGVLWRISSPTGRLVCGEEEAKMSRSSKQGPG